MGASRSRGSEAARTGRQMNQHEALLQSQLEMFCAFQKNPQLIYQNGYNFVLKHGQWHKPQPLRPDVLHGPPKCCYGNAILLAVLHGWQYVEGYALANIGVRIPVQHAWNLDEHGRLVDCTWTRPGVAYRGVVFSAERADDATWNGDASILEDYHRGFPLFREPWTGEKP